MGHAPCAVTWTHVQPPSLSVCHSNLLHVVLRLSVTHAGNKSSTDKRIVGFGNQVTTDVGVRRIVKQQMGMRCNG